MIMLAPKDFVTTLPAATITPLPKTTPGRMVTLAPSQQLFPIITGLITCSLNVSISKPASNIETFLDKTTLEPILTFPLAEYKHHD